MASRARKFQPLRRTGHRPVEPLSAQVEYLRTLKGVLQYARALVNARLMPRVERWVGERTDANTPQNKQVSNVVGQIRSALESKFTDAKLERVAESTADRISDHQRAQLTAQVGVELPARSERGLGQVTDAFTFENVALIKSVPSQYLDGVQSAVLAGLSAGQRHEDLAKVLEAKFQIGEKRAALIARDQVNKFNGRLAQVRQENLGIVSYVWHAQPDQRTRDTHADRDGQTYDWSDPPGDLSDPADGGHPGQAINCFPGDTRISAPTLILKAYRRRYTGDLTELVTDDGESVRCTPNHPVLTERGWVPAQLVNVGENVFKTGLKGLDVGIEDLEHADTQAVEIFRTAQLLFSSRLSDAGATGFHGDATDQNVDIVDIDGSLALDPHTPGFQKLCEQVLSLAHDPASSLGPASQFFGAALTPPHSGVRGGCQILSLLSREGRVPNEHCLAATSRLQACLHEVALYHAARDVEVFSHLLDAAPLSVHGLQRLARQVYAVVRAVVGQPSDLVTPSAESLAQALGVYTEQTSDIDKALSGQKRSRVVEKRVSKFSGHVYNLETACNWYSANRITSHNCRCWAEGIIPGLEDDATETEPTDDEGEDDAPEPVKRELDFEMTGGTRPPPWDSRSSMHGEWLKQRLPGGSSNGEDDE